MEYLDELNKCSKRQSFAPQRSVTGGRQCAIIKEVSWRLVYAPMALSEIESVCPRLVELGSQS